MIDQKLMRQISADLANSSRRISMMIFLVYKMKPRDITRIMAARENWERDIPLINGNKILQL